jgi:DnaJ-domain-containing protein 1
MTQQILIVLICFAGGYFLVNQLWNVLPELRVLHQWPLRHARRGTTTISAAEHSCKVLGISIDADLECIRVAYLSQIEKYDPTKVAYLGPEFVQMSAARTQEIVIAYEILTSEKSNRRNPK